MRKVGQCRGSAPRARLGTFVATSAGGVRRAGCPDAETSRLRSEAFDLLIDRLADDRRHRHATVGRDAPQAPACVVVDRKCGAIHGDMLSPLMSLPHAKTRAALECSGRSPERRSSASLAVRDFRSERVAPHGRRITRRKQRLNGLALELLGRLCHREAHPSEDARFPIARSLVAPPGETRGGAKAARAVSRRARAWPVRQKAPARLPRADPRARRPRPPGRRRSRAAAGPRARSA